MADSRGSQGPIDLEFHCDVTYFDERAAVVVRGQVDVTDARVLSREMLAALTLPIRQMTVDLSRVTTLDDSGIDALLNAQTNANELGIDFRLLSVPLPVHDDLVAKGMLDHPT